MAAASAALRISESALARLRRVGRRDVDVIGKGRVKRIGFHPQLMDARGGLRDRAVIVIIEMRGPGADLDHAEAARANARQAIKNVLLVKAAG